MARVADVHGTARRAPLVATRNLHESADCRSASSVAARKSRSALETSPHRARSSPHAQEFRHLPTIALEGDSVDPRLHRDERIRGLSLRR
jgi:hypothetical protein